MCIGCRKKHRCLFNAFIPTVYWTHEISIWASHIHIDEPLVDKFDEYAIANYCVLLWIVVFAFEKICESSAWKFFNHGILFFDIAFYPALEPGLMLRAPC